MRGPWELSIELQWKRWGLGCPAASQTEFGPSQGRLCQRDSRTELMTQLFQAAAAQPLWARRDLGLGVQAGSAWLGTSDLRDALPLLWASRGCRRSLALGPLWV